jgi:uncharacterized Fe-S cluster protein YjdI
VADIEPDAGEGGAGAPPAETAANRVRAGLTREYARPEIRVQWFASRCIHSGVCMRTLPAVFDSRRRPWIDISAADADAIADAVVRCPTGALQYERLDGGANEEPGDGVRITPVRNGPYFVRGSFEFIASDGTVHHETRVALCRCGQSKHMPFCDNTHRAIGFRSQP